MTRFLLCFLLACVPAFSAVYTPPNTATWTPGVTVGVPGGIPTNRTNLINVTQAPYNADNTGATNTVAAINAAINDAPQESVVYLPAGTYRVDSQIYIAGNKTNITLRGAGIGNTIIDARGSVGVTFGLGVTWSNPFNPHSTITAGLTAGSTTLTVASGTGFVANRGAHIVLPDDSAIPVVSTYGYTELGSFSVQVTAVSGNTITVSPAIPATFGVTAGASLWQSETATSYGIGVESMTISGTNSSGAFRNGVQGNGTLYGSWVTDLKIIDHANYGIFLADSMMVEVRRCWITGGGTGPNHAGFLVNTITGGLYEDNIVIDNFPSFEVNFATVGSVFAFNYTKGGSKGLDSNHAPQNAYNLYEGNVTQSVQADGYYGGVQADTFFRNWVYSVDAGSPLYSFSFCRFTRKYNLVGNIIQSSGYAYGSDGVSMGNPNLGNGSYNGTAEPSTGDYWLDYNSGTGRSKTWTGTLTSRPSDTAGTVTLDTGQGTGFAAHLAASFSGFAAIGYGSGSLINTAAFATPVGDVVTFTGASGPLPALGASVTLYPSPDGYQELDLDVANTTNRKGNYYYFSHSIPAGESLSDDTLADSLFRASKPTSWGPLTWPAFDASAPGTPAVTNIPAGYFYVNGVWPSTTGAAPVITLNPVSQSVATGTTVTFTANANGDPTPTWQWYKNGSSISGQTASLLFLPSVTSGDAATYYAIATNSGGSAQTNSAILTVTSASSLPVITTNPSSQSVTAGSNVTFTAAATGNPTPAWQWYFNSILMPGKTSSTLSLTAVTAASQGVYYARATNVAGTALTSAAQLTVRQGPTTTLKAPVITSVN